MKSPFHEKAGRCQVVFFVFSWDKVFLPPSCQCRHPSIRTLRERFSLGASWVFSFQPVLPPDYRPPVPSGEWKLGQAIDAVTGTRRLGFFLP